MMTTTEIILFVFGHVWLKWRQSCRSRSRRRRALAQMQWLNAFDNQQEEDPCEILICFAATGLFLSMLQWRSVWVRSRSQSFACIIKLWSDLEWKRNFQFSRATFQHFCSELRGCLQRSSTVCNKRVAIALWRLGTSIEYRTISHLFGVGASVPRQFCYNTTLCKTIVHSSPKFPLDLFFVQNLQQWSCL